MSNEFVVDNAAVGPWGQQIGQATLVNVHDSSRCKGRGCSIHHPSEHMMRDWPLNWRDDVGLMERLCSHGVGHPDPDDIAFKNSIGRFGFDVHGCDGCCISR